MKIDLTKMSETLRGVHGFVGRALCVALIATGSLACASSQSTGEENPETGGETPTAEERGEMMTGKGCVLGDCQTGTGTFVYENGDRYVGAFKDGQRDGKGTFEYANGDRFVGEYAAGKRNGEGTYIFKNGDRYVGRFKDGLRDGQGVYTFNQGGVFRGEFVEDGNKGAGTLVQGEKPFECDLRNRGLFCESAKEGKVINEAVDDSGLSGDQ